MKSKEERLRELARLPVGTGKTLDRGLGDDEPEVNIDDFPRKGGSIPIASPTKPDDKKTSGAPVSVGRLGSTTSKTRDTIPPSATGVIDSRPPSPDPQPTTPAPVIRPIIRGLRCPKCGKTDFILKKRDVPGADSKKKSYDGIHPDQPDHEGPHIRVIVLEL